MCWLYDIYMWADETDLEMHFYHGHLRTVIINRETVINVGVIGNSIEHCTLSVSGSKIVPGSE